MTGKRGKLHGKRQEMLAKDKQNTGKRQVKDEQKTNKRCAKDGQMTGKKQAKYRQNTGKRQAKQEKTNKGWKTGKMGKRQVKGSQKPG